MKCSVIEQAKRDWAAVYGPDDDEDGEQDEVDQSTASTGISCYKAEQSMCRQVDKDTGYHVVHVVRGLRAAARQIVVCGDGDLEALIRILSAYLCQVPWVFVEAILDDKPRARLVVYHDGTPGDPNRLSCRVDPLPSWGTYQERLVPGHEITEGVQAIGRCFVASVHGKRIGTYGTPEEAAHARSAWLLVHSEGPA